MKKILLVLSIVLIVGASELWAQCRDIRIPRGRISTVVKGFTTKDRLCYRVRARFGQKITLHLASPERRVNFSLFEDYYDSGFTANSVREWQGELSNTDTYLIYVGGDGVKPRTPFTLELTIR